MILLTTLLVLVAVGLLVTGLAQGSATLQWASFAVSGLAAVLLAVTELRRRRRTRAEEAETGAAARSGPVRTAAGAPGEEDVVRRVLPPPVPSSSPALPRVPGPVSGATAVSGLGDLARPTEDPGAPVHRSGGPPYQQGRRTGSHSATDLPRVPAGPPAGTGGWPVQADAGARLGADGEPPAEEVEVTDLLLVLDLTDEVLVVDEHPRYHLAGCPHLVGVAPIPLPMVEARTDGFTPCGTCTPDRSLARRERSRRS